MTSQFDDQTGEYKPRVTTRRERRGDGLTAHTVEVKVTTFEAMTDEHTATQRAAMRRANHESMNEWVVENNDFFSDTLGNMCRHIEDSLQRILQQAGWKCENPEALLIDRRWSDGAGIEDNRPHAGPGWFACEIDMILTTIRSRDHTRHDPLQSGLPMDLFKAGCLLTELSLRTAHNDYFMRQQSITEAQKTSSRSLRRHSDHFRRETVREFMLAGLLATSAAQMAAERLGVSLTTIRNAFPDKRLPKAADF